MGRLIILCILIICVGVSEEDCNCFECKDVTEGIHKGTYYFLDQSGNTGTCLYRDPHTGKIIRACDEEASLGDSYSYEIFQNITDILFLNRTSPKAVIDGAWSLH